MYSTPSGHASTISTNDPSSVARPSVASTRARPSGPPTAVPPSLSAAPGVVGAAVPVVAAAVVSDGAAVGATVGAVSAVIVKLMLELPLGELSAALTVTTALQVPFGIGLGTVVVSDRASAPTTALPTENGSPLQVTITWLMGPSGSAKVNCRLTGEADRLVPSAGFDPVRVLSAWATWPAEASADRPTPSAMRTNPRRARRRNGCS
jgi:hypothetical protein